MGKYLIILHGSVPPTLEGEQQLRTRLIQELGCEPGSVDAMFDNLPAIIQNSLEAEQAQEYLKVLQAFGGDVEILEADSTGAFPAQTGAPQPDFLSAGSLDGSGGSSQSMVTSSDGGESLLEFAAMEESVSDLLDILDHELDGEDTDAADAAALDNATDDFLSAGLEFGDATAHQAEVVEPAAPSAPVPMIDESQLADLEAELTNALSFGDADTDTDFAPQAAAPASPHQAEPEALVDFGFGSFEDAAEAAQPVIPQAQTPAAPADHSDIDSLFGMSLDDEVAALNTPPAATGSEVSESAEAFFAEETGQPLPPKPKPRNDAPVLAEVSAGNDADPLEARMAAPAPDEFKWPDDAGGAPNTPAVTDTMGAFGARAQASVVPAVIHREEIPEEELSPEEKARRAARQKKLVIGGTAIIAVCALIFFFLTRPPEGFQITSDSLDAMLQAQTRIAKQRAANAPIPESERTWIGSIELPEMTVKLEVTTLQNKLLRWYVATTTPEPPPLTEEEFGTGVERPWMKRAEADGAYSQEIAPSGNTVGFKGPGRAYVQHLGGTARLSVEASGQIKREGEEKMVALWKIQTRNAAEITEAGQNKVFLKKLPDGQFVVRLIGEVNLVPGVSTIKKPPQPHADQTNTEEEAAKE